MQYRDEMLAQLDFYRRLGVEVTEWKVNTNAFYQILLEAETYTGTESMRYLGIPVTVDHELPNYVTRAITKEEASDD